MPTVASCGVCDWEEEFETRGEAREAQISHVHQPAFVEDVAEIEV